MYLCVSTPDISFSGRSLITFLIETVRAGVGDKSTGGLSKMFNMLRVLQTLPPRTKKAVEGPAGVVTVVELPRVYLAAAFRRQDELIQYKHELESLGFTVTSRWLSGTHNADLDGQYARYAQEDLDDIAQADVVISFTEAPDSNTPPRGGRHVEFGYGYALCKEMYLIGYRENVFHHLPGVHFYPSWVAMMAEAGQFGIKTE
jgi:hypothetical protein